MRPALKAAIGSLAAGMLVLGFKLAAAKISGSTALYSDALETLVNLASSSLALYALIIAARPADSTHHYGHAKAELLSATATGAMIIAAAVIICEEALSKLAHPPPLAPLYGALGLGLALNLFAGLLNGLWAGVLFVIGRRAKSAALTADAEHLLSDLISTAGILAGLLAAAFLRLPILDPLLALAIAAQIAFMGTKTVLRALNGLLDAAPPPDVTARIQNIVRTHATGAIEAHDLRMRESGAASFLEFHLVVPGSMSVTQAHTICDNIESALKAELDNATITIHIEPEGKAKHHGVIVR